MKHYLIAAFAALTLTACSSSDGQDRDLSSAWGSITKTFSKDAITDYTDVIYQHSKESVANFSFQTVQMCQIKEGGMTEDDFIELIQRNQEVAKRCWDNLMTYPTKDKRFFKEGSIEKEVLSEFEINKERYAKLLSTHDEYSMPDTNR